MSIGLMAAAGGAGPLVHTGVTVKSGSQLGWAWIDGITTVIGGTVVGSTSQCDFSRFARRPGNQFKGQIFALLFFGNVIPVFGLLGTSAASQLYGDVDELGLWNPPNIVQIWLDREYDNPKIRAATFFVSLGLLCSMVAINTVENGISGGMDAAGLLPKYINIRRGSYLIMVISIIIQPWQIISKASTFTSVLDSFGGKWLFCLCFTYFCFSVLAEF
jgi:nucleobase:cation symporter-1, NCS1 family